MSSSPALLRLVQAIDPSVSVGDLDAKIEALRRKGIGVAAPGEALPAGAESVQSAADEARAVLGDVPGIKAFAMASGPTGHHVALAVVGAVVVIGGVLAIALSKKRTPPPLYAPSSPYSYLDHVVPPTRIR